MRIRALRVEGFGGKEKGMRQVTKNTREARNNPRKYPVTDQARAYFISGLLTLR